MGESTATYRRRSDAFLRAGVQRVGEWLVTAADFDRVAPRDAGRIDGRRCRSEAFTAPLRRCLRAHRVGNAEVAQHELRWKIPAWCG